MTDKRTWYIAMTFKFKDRRLTVADIPDIDNPFHDGSPQVITPGPAG
jgi:hypothetical protein